MKGSLRSRIRPWSLRGRLMAIAAFVCTSVLLAGGFAMYRAAAFEDDKMLDARLASLAQVVFGFAEHEIEEVRAEGRLDAVQLNTESSLGSRYRYQIWSPDGRLLLRSHMASASLPLMPLAERGFVTVTLDGEKARVYAEVTGGGAMIGQVAELMRDRQAAIGAVSGHFLALLAIPLLLIVASSWALLNRSLRTIDGCASQLQQRNPRDLTPLRAENPPVELKPLVDSINALFGRIDKALSVERGFSAIAAHEMRTPLAGLRVHAQLAARAASPQESTEALRALLTGIDHASRLLDQLLDVARSDGLVAEDCRLHEPVLLQAVYHRVVSDLGPAASERDLVLMARFEAEQVQADEQGLYLIMHNLLANAIQYTPQGGRIEVGSAEHEGVVTLTFDDSGPGIPAARHLEAFERFNRLDRADSQGVGLGLSIVQAVAQAHAASVRLGQSSLGGLRVEVQFAVRRRAAGSATPVPPDARPDRPAKPR